MSHICVSYIMSNSITDKSFVNYTYHTILRHIMPYIYAILHYTMHIYHPYHPYIPYHIQYMYVYHIPYTLCILYNAYLTYYTTHTYHIPCYTYHIPYIPCNTYHTIPPTHIIYQAIHHAVPCIYTIRTIPGVLKFP